MKRVLIISYYWPPTGGSGVQRWVKFCKYLPSFGWQPIVYTPLNPEQLATDNSLLGEIPDCAEVIKTKIIEPYSIYNKLRGKKATEVNPVNAQKKGLGSRIAMWIRGNLFIPDPRILWVRPSLRFLKKYLREHPVDVIVTTGPPQSMHLIGLGLKKALGVKWIVDFRDPWTEMFYYKHLGLSAAADKKHHRLEQAVLDAADKIIAVSPLVAEDFRAKTRTEVVLVTNGFDEDDFGGNNEGSSRIDEMQSFYNEEKLRIVHTGLFAADGNPTALWEVLAELCLNDCDFANRLEIRLAGKTDKAIVDSIFGVGLGDKLINLGYLSHNEIVKEQQRATILLLALRKEPEYAKVLPGKIFEYMAARKPVLGIGQSDSVSAGLLRESGVGNMFDWNDKDGIKKFLREPLFESRNIERYSRKHLTEELVSILNKF